MDKAKWVLSVTIKLPDGQSNTWVTKADFDADWNKHKAEAKWCLEGWAKAVDADRQ
jgi:hypothetical protein